MTMGTRMKLSDLRIWNQCVNRLCMACKHLSKKMIVSCFLLLCLLFLADETVLAKEYQHRLTGSPVTPAYAYLEIQRVGQLIDQLGLFMGIPHPTPLNIKISNASPHDVYFQARTLVIKSDRLLFELMRQHRVPPALPGNIIGPAEVKTLLMEALQIISEVSQELGVLNTNSPPTFDETITPSDVFLATMEVNRHLNMLLERRFSPDEVYRVVNLAISYASNMLAQYPAAQRIPNKPLYEKNKQPSDVYFRLYNCLQLIIKTYQAQEYDILQIDISDIKEKSINPSDAFDLASLIVSRLDYLHKKNKISRIPRETYFPGRKFSSDVYQQATILELQLTALLSYMSAN